MNKYSKIIVSKRQFETLLGLVVILFCLNGVAIQTFAQVDVNTLLLLSFENSLNGEQGETPTSATGHSFQSGIQGQGALLPNPNQINYSSVNNINATEGTLEFWVKPTWNGNDGQDHYILKWGVGGGMLVGKDGANNLRIILNRFGTFPGGEKGVSVNINSWLANQWHHVAFTYSNTTKLLRVFVDGSQKSQAVFTGDLPSVSASTFQVGGDGAGSYINSVVDEFHISNIARTPQEIATRFVSALTVSSLTANPNTLQLLETWWQTPTLQAVTNIGTLSVPPSAASWTSSNSAVADFDLNRGKIVAHSAGSATLTATLNGSTTNITVNVTAPVLPPLVENISPFLATPNPDALWEMPVVIINYLPTTDGINVDSEKTGWTQSLTGLRDRINRIDLQHKFMLEEGSRFRAYGNSLAKPSLGYRIVSIITVYEEHQPLYSTCDSNGACQPDYEQILTRFNGGNAVNNLGVKEFWIGGYHHGNIYPVESNMSSPTTGDISNSYRLNDLPIYDKTYVVYGINFTRTASEATHNHGHQLESILSYSNQRQDGNTQLFWQKFVGQAANGAWQRGRAGDTHHPPNALTDYDYSNTTPFASDIADWNPNGGTTQSVSLPTWYNINYPFPDSIAPPQDDAWWYIYWFQSMPGRGNAIPYNSNRMTNWWQFTGDWDRAIRSGTGLYEAANCNYTLSANSQDVASSGGIGSVTVTAGSGCKWFASNNANWTPLTSGDLGDGNGTVNFTIAPNPNGISRTTKIIIAGQIFAVNQFASPTAASVTIGGRVLTADGRGISKAIVTLTNFSGVTRTVGTNPFGYYRFNDVQVGESQILNVKHKLYTFVPQVVTVNDDVSDLNFVANKLPEFKDQTSEECFICSLSSAEIINLNGSSLDIF